MHVVEQLQRIHVMAVAQCSDPAGRQDWLVDEISDQETPLAESEESHNRRKALGEALTVLNDRERRIFEARRLADDPITLEDLASEFGISRERVRQIEVRAFRSSAHPRMTLFIAPILRLHGYSPRSIISPAIPEG